jgi:xylulokinase
VIATVDLGTTFTKVALWDRDGLVAQAQAPVETVHPQPGWAEQDPSEWWGSVVTAFGELRSRSGSVVAGGAGGGSIGSIGSVEAIGCTGARQTIVLADAEGQPLGPALAWTDLRATAEADALAATLGGPAAVFDLTGVPLDAGSVAGKLAWLEAHDPKRLDAAAWVLAPRDFVSWRMTGEVATDLTMASRSGLYGLDGRPVAELTGAATAKLAPVLDPGAVSGTLVTSAAAELGLTAGIPVVIGGGDRACEVVGTGASASCPMISWGTTANISTPVETRPTTRPLGIVLSRAADGGWLLEGGLSAAGSFLGWLGRITGHQPASLAALASQSPPGARGVIAVPWLDGARAPSWNLGARAGFVGLSSAHGLADLSRALIESVGWEVKRCLDAMSARAPAGPAVTELALAGSGADVPVWVEVLSGMTGRPVSRRRSGQAASAGAALLAASAIGSDFDLETMDPVCERIDPEASVVASYAVLGEQADRVADRLLDLGHDLAGGPTVDLSDVADDLDPP